MRVQYVLTEKEVREAKNKLHWMQELALMNRDAGDHESSREYYLKAKGFEEALILLGILREIKNK